MDQRDEFARAALYGMLAHPVRYKPRHSECHLHWHDAIASEAYDIADAMISARGQEIVDAATGVSGRARVLAGYLRSDSALTIEQREEIAQFLTRRAVALSSSDRADADVG